MSRRARAPLAELLEVVERDVVAGEVERRVLEDAGMPGREDEAVASRPVWVGRIVPHHVAVEQIRHRCESHRRPRVTGVRLLHCVHRECADRVDRFRAGVRGHCSASISARRLWPRLPYGTVSVLIASNLRKELSGDVLFDGISFSVDLVGSGLRSPVRTAPARRHCCARSSARRRSRVARSRCRRAPGSRCTDQRPPRDRGRRCASTRFPAPPI